MRATAEGAQIDLNPRDAAYYKQAARILGLLDGAGSPTPIGLELTKNAEPQDALRKAFIRSDVAKAWLACQGVEHLEDLDPESAEDFLQRCTDLSEATIQRRAVTLRAWLAELAPHSPSRTEPASTTLDRLCAEPLTPEELELAEILLEVLRESDKSEQVVAVAEVLLAALVRVEDGLERARDVVTWLNKSTPSDWHYTIGTDLLRDAVRHLEDQGYQVLRAQLPPLSQADVPTQVIEFEGDTDGEDANALVSLLEEFYAGHGTPPKHAVSTVGSRSRVTLEWPTVSFALRPTAPIRICWLHRTTKPYVLPLVRHGAVLHITTLHHVASLAMTCGETRRIELVDTTGDIARWSKTAFEDSQAAYWHRPGVLMDTPATPDQRPLLWWHVSATPLSHAAPDPEALLAALEKEPAGGPEVAQALGAYATELPRLEFGPPAPETRYETTPPDAEHLVLAPTGFAIRLAVPESLPVEIRRDLLLHALGHILLGHIRADSDTALWDTAATIRLGPTTRPLDADVQTTFLDWFPSRASVPDGPPPAEPTPAEKPAADNETFLLALRAILAMEPWHVDPFYGLRHADVDPLPHQVSAVYDHLLTGQPLRMLLADDPGAGKTIMAGLLIRERLIRGTLKRCLIVAPGGLVDQWQGELEDRFGLEFEQLDSNAASPFAGKSRLLLARLDQLARNKSLMSRLVSGAEWDLVVVDEAHKMSAEPRGRSFETTARYRLGSLLREVTRDLLLMTATPHNGIEGCFQLSLALLDRDRFCGPYLEPYPEQKTHDILLRRVKEDLVRFDGSKLFPERYANTVAFELDPAEQQLYEDLTAYVRDEMNRVSSADAQTANRVGFAMQVLQRRLASSPSAIHISLQRRRQRLQRELTQQRMALSQVDIDRVEDLPDRELEQFEDEVASAASSARSQADLKREIGVLADLERQAKQILNRNIDSKWRKLRELLDQPPLLDGNHRHKLVVFTESRDTLNHLRGKLRQHFGRAEAVTEIHGGTSRKQRREAVEAFMTDPSVKVLVANDAAGEGVNLQGAHFLVNYDLPWNPNRLEQRFGRIHRIGQAHDCLFWNLLASGTREGDVYIRLLEKLEVERKALGGRVYDVLGELFENRPLSDILREATLRGTQGDEEVEHVGQGVRRALDRGSSLVTRAEASPAQLHARLDASNQDGFLDLDEVLPDVLDRLGGRMRQVNDHWTVQRVPGKVRRIKDAAGRRLPGRYRELPRPVPRTHALPAATVQAFLEEHQELLRDGAVLDADLDLPGAVPAMLVEVDSGDRQELRLVAWDGRLVDLAPRAGSLTPSCSSEGVGSLELDDATRSVTEALMTTARAQHEAMLPRIKAQRRATIRRLERALEEQEAHVEQLAQQRDQDATRAREELRDLESRLRDAETRFARLETPPSTKVNPLARFTLRPRSTMPVEAPADASSEPASSDRSTPHEVQKEALRALAEAREEGKRAGLVVMATGLGKTWLSAFDFQAAGAERGLFIAHRDEILSQAAATWGRLLPNRSIGFYDGKRKDTGTDLLFASVQTLSRRKHLQKFKADAFDYIVVDEFHHAAAAGYRRLIHHFTPSFLLGMTATPDRTDGASLLALCEGNELFRASLVEGISRRLLAPFHYYGLVSELDYDQVNWRSGRFDLEELTDLAEPWTEQAWARFLEHADSPPRRTLVFCCTTRHADYVARFLRDRSVKAVAVHSKPSSADRQASLRRLREGSLEAICCVDVFNEGVDLPEVDHVLMLRPTESPIVFLQQLGRGLRTAPGKDSLTVVDFIGNHRSFLLKPAVLMQLTGESPNPSASVQRLKQKSVRLPPECSIEVETEAIDLLEQLARRSPQDVLLLEYERFWEAHGRRPLAAELFAAGVNLKAVEDGYGTWFDFVFGQGDLDCDEERVLTTFRPWFEALWALRADKTYLRKSFPLLALQVVLDQGALCGDVSTDSVVVESNNLLTQDPLLRTESEGTELDLEFWTSQGPAGRRQFERRGSRWCSLLQANPKDEEILASMTAELIDVALRRRRYAARLKVVEGGYSWLLKVSHEGNERPMIRLHRHKHPTIPGPGPILLEADGTMFEAEIAKAALNVVRPRGGGANMLPELLRSWFGPRAGSTGTRHFVRLEQLGTHFRLSPDEGVGPLAHHARSDTTELAFFPDQKAACGLHPTVDLRGEAPVSVPVAGDLDPRRHFLVKADGDSMDGGPTPIRNGDLVLCRWLTEAERDPARVAGPCLLVGRNGGDPLVTIKTPRRRDGQWWLMGANPKVPDQPLRPGMRLTPVAKVVGPAEADLRFQLWRSYAKVEIAALFGTSYATGRQDPVWDKGYAPLDNLGHLASVLFIRLRKDRSMKQEHRYRDGFQSRSVFLWETQNQMGGRTKSGERHKWALQVLNHEAEGRKLHFFLQTQKGDPFIYCGALRYLDHDEPLKPDGKHPMRCRMELEKPLPDRLWSLWGS